MSEQEDRQTTSGEQQGVSWVRWLPLGIFLLLAVFLGIGLTLNPNEVPSPLIGKPAPAFELPRLDNEQQIFSSSELHGKVWLLNVWASWCVSCREEHPVIAQLASTRLAEVIGLNYKDDSADARRWLARFGDPYLASAVDREGRVGIDWGVYAVPETFIIDKQGIVRYKHTGPVTVALLNEKLIPLLKQLQEEG